MSENIRHVAAANPDEKKYFRETNRGKLRVVFFTARSRRRVTREWRNKYETTISHNSTLSVSAHARAAVH